MHLLTSPFLQHLRAHRTSSSRIHAYRNISKQKTNARHKREVDMVMEISLTCKARQCSTYHLTLHTSHSKNGVLLLRRQLRTSTMLVPVVTARSWSCFGKPKILRGQSILLKKRLARENLVNTDQGEKVVCRDQVLAVIAEWSCAEM